MVSMLVSSTVDRGFIDGVMVSMLVSSAVDRGFIDGVMVSMLVSSTVDRSSGIACSCLFNPKTIEFVFSAKDTFLRSKSIDCLDRIHVNVSEWRDMYTRGLLFQ